MITNDDGCYFSKYVSGNADLFNTKSVTLIPAPYTLRYLLNVYRKFPKYSDTQKLCCNHSKSLTMWLYYSVNNADGMANSVDPDQTAPLGAV